MHRRVFVIVAALFATLSTVAAPPYAGAQASPNECKRTCKTQKEFCQKSFKAQANDAKQTCVANYRAAKPACGGDSGCKRTIKQEFRACKRSANETKTRAKSCVDDEGGFKTCKKCCKGEAPGPCGIKICDDGQIVAPEECDDGAANSDAPDTSCDPIPDACRSTCELAHCGDGAQDCLEDCDNGTSNSDTTPDACRTTCVPPKCGDGVQDTGDGCDDGPNNSDTAPGACRTTCEPPRCGDGVTDPSPPNSEECDGNDDACVRGRCGIDCKCLLDCGDNDLDADEECDGTADAACACPGSCLPNCSCLPRFTRLTFTTDHPGGNCGRINDDPAGTGTNLTPYGATSPQLECGTLYIGGGGSAQPPSPTPDGATSQFNTVCGDPTALVLSATTSAETGNNQSCTSPGCFFGPPLPIPNSGEPGTSTCVINSIAATPPVRGTLDAVTGMSTTTLPLTVAVRVTGDLQADTPGLQPCPTCTNGTCDSGANSGGTCATTTSLLTSHDCLPEQTTLAPFGVDLSPLATGNAVKTAPLGDGDFCGPTPGQRSLGAFGQPTANFIETLGSKAGDMTTGVPRAAIQSSVFCIPSSSSTLVDSVADLPGPGAVTLKGSSQLLP